MAAAHCPRQPPAIQPSQTPAKRLTLVFLQRRPPSHQHFHMSFTPSQPPHPPRTHIGTLPTKVPLSPHSIITSPSHRPTSPRFAETDSPELIQPLSLCLPAHLRRLLSPSHRGHPRLIPQTPPQPAAVNIPIHLLTPTPYGPPSLISYSSMDSAEARTTFRETPIQVLTTIIRQNAKCEQKPSLIAKYVRPSPNLAAPPIVPRSPTWKSRIGPFSP